MDGEKLARHFKILIVAVLLAFAVSMELPLLLFADDLPNTIQTPRFILHIGNKQQSPQKTNFNNTNELATAALSTLESLADELNRIFDYRPQQQVVLRFLTPKEFSEQTGAPLWTSAMFFRGEIIVPLSDINFKDRSELARALRHEYTHALIADMSNYSSPAWLDEGIAQIIEGAPHPAIGPAFRSWLSENETMPLEWLEGGFMKLDPKLVPAAYGESLFIARHLINTHGMKRVVAFLKDLGNGTSAENAFFAAFSKNYSRFNKDLNELALRWSNSNAVNP